MSPLIRHVLPAAVWGRLIRCHGHHLGVRRSLSFDMDVVLEGQICYAKAIGTAVGSTCSPAFDMCFPLQFGEGWFADMGISSGSFGWQLYWRRGSGAAAGSTCRPTFNICFQLHFRKFLNGAPWAPTPWKEYQSPTPPLSYPNTTLNVS